MEYCKFLEYYRFYTTGNETPESIHLWCGLAGLAGAAERRFWIDRNFFKIILNLYIMFLAPAGVCAKSTAMGLIASMLEEIGAKVFEGSITKRKIVKDMEENVQSYTLPDGKQFLHSSVTFASDELNELVSSGGGEIIKFLTTIFSKTNRYVDRTATQGCFEIPRPYLNLIGNVVPQWFSQNLANDLSATGLIARFIILFENAKRGSEPNPKISKEQYKAREKAIEILYWIYQEFGEIKLSDEAEDYYAKWYMKQKADPGEDFRFLDYFERKNRLHVMKISALMALGDCRKVIEVIDLKRAIHILDKIDANLKFYYKTSGTNKYAIHINRIINILDSLGGKFPTRKIARMLASNLTNEEFVAVIKQLDVMEIAKLKTINGVSYLVKVIDEEKKMED